jgi:hypothetical protein
MTRRRTRPPRDAHDIIMMSSKNRSVAANMGHAQAFANGRGCPVAEQINVEGQVHFSYDMSGRSGLMFEKSETSPSA